jgi:hypothetical protein
MPKKSHSKQKYYLINNGNYMYGATITKDTYLHRDVIKFGGKKECIHITIYENLPNIDGLGYGRKCALKKPLIPGSGTENMLKTALTFVCVLYPQTVGFLLKDTSSVKCQDGETFSLAFLYMAKHGQTWYQKKFGAVPERNEITFSLENFNKEFTSTKIKDSVSWKHFKKNFLERTHLNKQTIDRFEVLYVKSKSWRNFVVNILKEFDCSVLKEWLYRLITSTQSVLLGIDHEEFRITRQTIDEWNMYENITVDELESTTFEKKTKTFMMNVLDGGNHKVFDPYLQQPMPYWLI